MLKRALIFLALAGIVALPFLLRPRQVQSAAADDTLVIITPHNEAIRHEFGTGFRTWYRQRTGRTVAIDWRVIGGTSEIERFLESEYVAAFRNHWTRKLGRDWSTKVQSAFANPRVDAAASATARAAREAFLGSEVSCGIDLFFGGGSYDFVRQANAGRIVASRLLRTRPEWFNDAVIPSGFAGEQYWDPQGRWFGNVLSSYGILCNLDALKRLGLATPPQQWTDLTDARYIGEIALADPTKSSSMVKAFENLIQQQMQARLAELQRAHPAVPSAALEAQAVREGWIRGLQVLQRIGANARYFTDSSQKPPIDVAQGNTAAGICIDFYGRAQAEAVRRRDDSSRLAFVTPHGGTVNSVDPIAILRGAPHREVAELFIEYTLSPAGQQLWNFKVGVPGGPERFALRRLPVRRDFYAQAEWRPLRSDPDDAPYADADQLVYHVAWTGGLFREMAFITRVMCLDTHDELTAAWREIAAAGSPAAALAVLGDMSAVDYDQAQGAIHAVLTSRNRVEELKLAKELGDVFRQQYRKAAELARASNSAKGGR